MPKRVNEKDREIVEFSDIYRGSLNSDGRIADYLGSEVVIEKVEFTELGNVGQVGIIECFFPDYPDKKMRLHTFSQVLLNQLEVIKKYTDQGKKVRVKIVKKKRYYTFE